MSHQKFIKLSVNFKKQISVQIQKFMSSNSTWILTGKKSLYFQTLKVGPS